MASIYRKPDGTWYLNDRINGRRLRLSLQTTSEDEARKALARWVKYGRTDGIAEAGAKDWSLSELADWYVESCMPAKGYVVKSRKDSRRILGEFVSYMRVQKILTVGDLLNAQWAIDGWVGGMADQQLPGTVYNSVVKVKACFNQAEARDMIPRVPEFPRIRRGERRFDGGMTEREFRALLGAAKGAKHYDALVVLAFQGCRPSDVCGLTWQDVDFENNILIIAQQKMHGKVVRAPMLPQTREALVRTKALHRPGKWVFPGRNGVKMRPGTLSLAIDEACRVAKIRHFSPKSFRQFFVMSLIANGVDRKVVGQLSGHQSTAIESYMRLLTDAARLAGQQFSTRFDEGDFDGHSWSPEVVSR